MLFLSKYSEWPRRPKWFTWPVISWSLYDLGETIFSFCVVSQYFALWVIKEKGGQDFQYSIAMSVSMIVAAMLQISLSPISDETGKRKIFVLAFTVISVVFTGLIGFANDLNTGLFYFVMANIGAQCALVFYNAMLADVADDRHLARISGIGTAIGYIGTLIGILYVGQFAEKNNYGPVFVPVALLFLGFSLPLFLFVREQPGLHSVSFVDGLRNSWEAFFVTMTKVFRRREILLFFIALLIGMEATHTVIMFMSIYAIEVVGISEVKRIFLGVPVNDVNIFYFMIVCFAFFGALIVGHLGDKWGHWRMLLVVMGIWVLGLVVGTVNTSKEVFYVVGALIAVGLGGIWTVSRSFLMAVCHPEEKSQMFALFGLVNKGAAIFGPLIWAGTVHLFRNSPDIKYRAALLSMAIVMFIGLLVMTRVRLEPRALEVFPDRK
jgi:MFS transporter, UMF1 family